MASELWVSKVHPYFVALMKEDRLCERSRSMGSGVGKEWIGCIQAVDVKMILEGMNGVCQPFLVQE
jgi:hypothetical protein